MMLSKCLVLVLAAAVSAEPQTTDTSYAITSVLKNDAPVAAAAVPAGVQPTAAQEAVQPGVQPGVAPGAAGAASMQTPSYQQPAAGVNSALGGQAAAQNPQQVAANAGFHTNVPMNGGNPMANMLGALTQVATAGSGGGGFNGGHIGSEYNGAQPDTKFSSAALGQESQAVVSGLIESFMHKVKLETGERQCLEQNMGTLTGDIMGTVGDIVTAIKALIEGKGHVQKDATSGLVSAGIDSAMKITSLVTMSTQLVKNCVHGDALILLKKCANHLVNGTYLEHRFIVNGVDIAHELSDSILAFEKKDFHRFGSDIGVSLRKLLLSKALNATTLPEGIPDQVIIQKATDGLMRGFFVSGSSVEITDTAHPDIDVNIDLHRCIAGNSPFFKELWMAAWDLIAKLSLASKEHGIGSAFQELGQQSKSGGQPKWTGELMIAMMQFPSALMRCGLSTDMQDTFMEAVKSLGDIQVHFHMPAGGMGTAASDQAEEVSTKMAKAVEAWTNWDFEKFGYELGELFRDLVMLAFPQKYSVHDGRLHRYSKPLTSNKASSISSSVVVIGGSAMVLFVVFATVRTRRSMPQLILDRQLMIDVEDGEADHSVE